MHKAPSSFVYGVFPPHTGVEEKSGSQTRLEKEEENQKHNGRGARKLQKTRLVAVASRDAQHGDERLYSPPQIRRVPDKAGENKKEKKKRIKRRPIKIIERVCELKGVKISLLLSWREGARVALRRTRKKARRLRETRVVHMIHIIHTRSF